MKKIITLTLALASIFSFNAQQEAPPQGINYQAVAVDNTNKEIVGTDVAAKPVADKEIRVRFSILKTSETGTLTYREVHLVTTDAYGLFNTVIGQGIPDASPNAFNQIDWGTGYHFLKVEIDITGGTDYKNMGTQQLWSVPYALYSKYADAAGNGIDSVNDNGDGTLTFTYIDGSTYTTSPLTGLTGPQGLEGEPGPQGPAGADGQDGLSAYEIWLAEGNTGTMSDFLNGITGPLGPQGIQGPAGSQGIQGPVGATGPQGPQGAQGTPGVAGPTGATGPAGVQGLQGTQGPAGTNGTNGSSAYQVALSNGFVGTEAQWLVSLQGATGVQGPAGAQGIQGIPGAVGATGATGQNGLNALIKTTTEAAGANCTNGGTKIETGIDANGNGVLDVGEVNASQTTYVCNGTDISSSGVQFSNMEVYSTPGSYIWTCPTGVTKIMVEVWGGGSGGNAGSERGGAGGGYGKQILTVIPGILYTLVVGVGGTYVAGAPPTATSGGTTNFSNLISATGGTAWVCCSSGGNGGTSSATFNVSGTRGRVYPTYNAQIGGSAGNGGNGGAPGENGYAPGGGGGTGANGASGRVVIWY